MLENKVAIVTGSGRGLGKAYAKALAAAGAAVVVNDVDGDVAEETAEEIRATGGRVAVEVVPVGSSQAADQLVARAVSEFGRLDVMCTNAGILRDRTLVKTSDEDFDAVIETHLRGTFTCGRSAVKQFIEQGEGGRLILVGSPAGQRGNFGQTAYSAAKAGIVGMARTWSLELFQRHQITVNTVSPGAITRMVETVPMMKDLVAAVEAGEAIPSHLRQIGIGIPEDAAGVVVFLASPAAAQITGQVLGVGGDRLSLWTHPIETVTECHDGSWDAESIAAEWPSMFAPKMESVGLEFPSMDEPSKGAK